MSTVIAFGRSAPKSQSELAQRVAQLITTNAELRKELAQAQDEAKQANAAAAAARVNWDMCHLNLKIEEATIQRLQSEINALRQELKENRPGPRRAL